MSNLRGIAEKIWSWAQESSFKGYDPYDGLSSRILGPLTRHSKLLRLTAIQAVKNCPFNPRKLLRIPPEYNPKGLALFLSGAGYLPELDKDNTIKKLQQLLLSLASAPDGSPAFSGSRASRNDISTEDVKTAALFAWGYNFPWQGRAFFQPAWFPTVVCSSFVLDSFHHCHSDFYPSIAQKLAEFTIDTLNIKEDHTGICFSYSPRDHSRVFNASLFAAKILARAAQCESSSADRYRELASKACNYVAARQREDGSWVYGEAHHWQWVDNLHTGFVLETLGFISKTLGISRHDSSIAKGLDYYKSNLFEKDWTARYFSNKKYPLDPHSYAQAAITFMELSDFESDSRNIAQHLLTKCISDLWSEKHGGFIFRKYRFKKNRTVFLRWSQGWMLKALCRFIGENE